jgi:Leucine-rich repeat (LRR) protein
MPFLSHVDLTGNQLQGGLPQVTRERETVGQQLGVEPLQTQLQVLKLGKNRLTGKLNQLMGLTQLKDVDLSQNQIYGSVPDSIVDLKHLGMCCDLWMHVFYLLSMGRKRNLQVLLMLFTVLCCSFPTKTEGLDLSNNQLSGGLPSRLGELVKLKWLQLDGNKLTGEVPKEVCALTTANTLQSFKTDCTSGDIKCDCCTACS